MSQSALFGQPCLHMSSKSDSSSAAIRCRPIRAHALSVSTGTGGLNCTAFVRAKELLLDEEEQELVARLVLPRDVPEAGCCAQAMLKASMDSPNIPVHSPMQATGL